MSLLWSYCFVASLEMGMICICYMVKRNSCDAAREWKNINTKNFTEDKPSSATRDI